MEPLTPAERTRLRFMLRFRDRPLTVWDQVANNRWRYALLFAGAVAATALLHFALGPIPAAFVGALFAGVLLRDFSAFRAAALGWSLNRAIIDWDRIERLLDEDATREDG